MVWFPHSPYQQVQQPSIPSPTTNDNSEWTKNCIELSFSHWRTSMGSNIFIGSYLLACTRFWIRKSLIFALFSLGELSHAALVLYLGLMLKCGLNWQKRRACKLGQNYFVMHIFEVSFLWCGFLIHHTNKSNNPRFRVPQQLIC